MPGHYRPFDPQAFNADKAGRQKFNSIFGQQHSEHRQVHIQSNFRYNIPDDSFLIFSNDGTSGTSGTGNYGIDTSSNAGVAFVETGTGTSGSAIIQDRNRIRYHAGQESGVIFTARFTTDPDAELNIGIYDSEDGFFLQHKNGNYRFVNRDTSTENVYPRSDWVDPLDGTGPSGETVDLTTLTILKISFGYLGSAPTILEYYAGPHAGWVVAEIIDFTDISGGTNVRNPSLPMRMEATRPDGDGNAILESGSWMGYALTNEDIDPGIRRFDTEGRRTSVSSSTNEHVVTVKNKGTYQGVANDIQIKPLIFNPISDSDDTTTFYLVRNATTADTRTYSDRNTENSVAEVSTTATSVTSSEKMMTREKIASSQNQRGAKGVQATAETERLEPGDSMTIYASTPGTPSLYEVVLRWEEWF
jgi:hypothetical protein